MCFTKWITKEKCSLLKTWQSEFLQQERLLQKFIHVHFGDKKGQEKARSAGTAEKADQRDISGYMEGDLSSRKPKTLGVIME